jgi:hypothetical protein
VDWPSARFYGQLIERYPDAKVLLSVRTGEEWVSSMRETVWGMFHGDGAMHHLCEARAAVDPLWRRFMTLMSWMNWNEGTGALAGETYSDEGLTAVMERWNDEVKRSVPADRLLVWSPREGWEPLCEFLEVPVPPAPLPHINDSAMFAGRIVDGSLAALTAWRARQRPAARSGSRRHTGIPPETEPAK